MEGPHGEAPGNSQKGEGARKNPKPKKSLYFVGRNKCGTVSKLTRDSLNNVGGLWAVGVTRSGWVSGSRVIQGRGTVSPTTGSNGGVNSDLLTCMSKLCSQINCLLSLGIS